MSLPVLKFYKTSKRNHESDHYNDSDSDNDNCNVITMDLDDTVEGDKVTKTKRNYPSDESNNPSCQFKQGITQNHVPSEEDLIRSFNQLFNKNLSIHDGSITEQNATSTSEGTEKIVDTNKCYGCGIKSITECSYCHNNICKECILPCFKCNSYVCDCCSFIVYEGSDISWICFSCINQELSTTFE